MGLKRIEPRWFFQRSRFAIVCYATENSANKYFVLGFVALKTHANAHVFTTVIRSSCCVRATQARRIDGGMLRALYMWCWGGGVGWGGVITTL